MSKRGQELTRWNGSQALAQLSTAQRQSLEEALLQLWNNLESAHSRRAYRSDWRKWCEWLLNQDRSPEKATAADVQRYLAFLAYRKKKRSTRARALAVLRKVYSAYVRAGLLPFNPAREADNIRVAKGDPSTPWMGFEQLRDLLAPPKPRAQLSWREHRDWMVMYVLAGTGLRRRDVARLRWVDLREIDRGKYMLHVVVKGDKEGDVPAPAWVIDGLRDWGARRVGGFATLASKDDAPIFPSRQDPVGRTRFLSDESIRQIVKRAAKRAGLQERQATPHAIRRSFTTIARQRGATIEDLQASLLHAHKSTTERYDKAARVSKNAPGELLADLVGKEDDDDR